MYRTVALVVLLVLTVSCFTTYDPGRLLDKTFKPTYLSLPGVVTDVAIEDSRSETTSRRIKVPWLPFPWQDDEVNPALTPTHRAFIETEIRKHFAGGEVLTARVVVTHGVQRFKANWFSEGEEAEFGLSIELMQVGHTLGEGALLGSAVLKVASIDAGASTIEDMYLKVIAASISECMVAFAKRERHTMP